jgi:hypothetical protein
LQRLNDIRSAYNSWMHRPAADGSHNGASLP